MTLTRSVTVSRSAHNTCCTYTQRLLVCCNHEPTNYLAFALFTLIDIKPGRFDSSWSDDTCCCCSNELYIAPRRLPSVQTSHELAEDKSARSSSKSLAQSSSRSRCVQLPTHTHTCVSTLTLTHKGNTTQRTLEPLTRSPTSCITESRINKSGDPIRAYDPDSWRSASRHTHQHGRVCAACSRGTCLQGVSSNRLPARRCVSKKPLQVDCQANEQTSRRTDRDQVKSATHSLLLFSTRAHSSSLTLQSREHTSTQSHRSK